MVLATAGASRVKDARLTHVGENVGELERLVSVITGGALAVYGLKRRGASGIGVALLGAELVRRGASGHCLVYEALGVNTNDGRWVLSRAEDITSRAATVNARRAVKIESAITVLVPPHDVYEFWREFENLPRFMRHLESVARSDDMHSKWTAKLPGGKTISWDAEIVNDIPDALIAWKTIGNPDIAHAGSVHFREAQNGTELRVVLDYEPPGAYVFAQIAKLFGHAPEVLIREDLRRFKALIESGSRVQSL